MDYFEPLAIKLKQTNLLTKHEIDGLLQSFQLEKIPKNRFFLQENERCSKIGFLINGILCSFIFNREGEEVVKHFIEPGQFFTDLDSFEQATEADLNIQALTDCDLLTISRESNRELLRQKPQWRQLLSLFSSEALNNMIRMRNFLHFGSAEDKYEYFLKHHPKLAQQVPLKYIASYLGITQSSLSRIRRQKL